MRSVALVLLGLVVGFGASFSGLGGGFLVVPLLLAMGFTPQRAVGTSFVAILVISVSALTAHGKLAQVDWKTGALIGIGGLLGAQLAPRVLQLVSAPVFHRIFALILVGLAVKMWFAR